MTESLGDILVATEPGLASIVTQLASDAREVASSEIAVVKARVGDVVGRYRGAAIYFAAAGTLALAALVALLVGLILTLSPMVGPGFATLIVIGVVLVLTIILALIGKAQLAPKTPLS